MCKDTFAGYVCTCGSGFVSHTDPKTGAEVIPHPRPAPHLPHIHTYTLPPMPLSGVRCCPAIFRLQSTNVCPAIGIPPTRFTPSRHRKLKGRSLASDSSNPRVRDVGLRRQGPAGAADDLFCSDLRGSSPAPRPLLPLPRCRYGVDTGLIRRCCDGAVGSGPAGVPGHQRVHVHGPWVPGARLLLRPLRLQEHLRRLQVPPPPPLPLNRHLSAHAPRNSCDVSRQPVRTSPAHARAGHPTQSHQTMVAPRPFNEASRFIEMMSCSDISR